MKITEKITIGIVAATLTSVAIAVAVAVGNGEQQEQPTAPATPVAEPSRSPVASPTPTVRVSTTRPSPRQSTTGPFEPEVIYADCAAVRAAGADPISLGQPGYSPELDPDGDGVACD